MYPFQLEEHSFAGWSFCTQKCTHIFTRHPSNIAFPNKPWNIIYYIGGVRFHEISYEISCTFILGDFRPMKLEISWTFMNFYELLMKFHELLWNFMKFYEILWNFMKFCILISWTFMNFYELLWTFMKFWIYIYSILWILWIVLKLFKWNFACNFMSFMKLSYQ